MKRSQIVGCLILALIALGGLAYGGWLQYREGQFRALFEEVRGQLSKAEAGSESDPPAVRGRVAVWDQAANKRITFTDRQLPASLLADSAAECETFVCITRIDKDSPQQFNNGEVGHRQVATLFLVLRPENKVLGPFVVKGAAPGWVVFKESKDEPILGDLSGPLATWIKALPREDSEQYRESLAQRKIIEQARAQLLAQEPAHKESLPALKGKVLVWDLAAGKPSPLQAQLPAELQGRSSDDPLTIVAIRSQRDEPEVKYSDGKEGYRCHVTIALLVWPAKRGLGRFEIAGEPPPLIHFSSTDKSDDDKIRGDISAPLKKWILDRTQQLTEKGPLP